MKKLTYVFSVIILVSLAAVSCDVLNEEVVSGVTAETFYSIPEGFEAAVNASYAPLRFYYGSEQGGNLTVMGTDIIRNGGHGGFHYMNHYDGELNSEQSPFWDLWSTYYRGINTTNAAVDRAAELEEIPEDEKNAKLGEVRFLRAHYYFTLVEHFGPVHLTLEETVGVQTEAERTPEDVIYSAIIDDLEFAIQHLPAEQEQWGRVTEPAAKNMLGLVLLTRGYKDFGESSDFSDAAALFDDVINNYNFELLPDPMDAFNHDNEQNAEIIFSVIYSQDPLLNETSFGNDGNHSHMHYRSWYEIHNDGLIRANDPGYGRPWQRFRPTPFGLENYRPLDVDSRYNKFFQDVWYYNDESTLPEGAAVGDTAVWVTDQELTDAVIADIEARLPGVEAPEEGSTGSLYTWHLDNRDDPWYMYGLMFPSLKKVDDWKRPSTNHADGNRDYIVYRLADTYLLAAEAYLQAGDVNTAVERVNTIRRRAAWPGMEAQMEITAAELDLDFLLDERGRELYGEQKRWLDLKRTGKLVERVRLYNPSGAAKQNIQDHHMLRPIPANQLTRTTNDYPQNPGY